jgi:superoxide reductase
MAKRHDVYKCGQDGVVVEILNDAGCVDLSCCGVPAELLTAKGADAGKEKHVPVRKQGAEGLRVEVGEVPHPMTEEHHIQWVEVINGPYVNRKYLKPGEAPAAEFYVPEQPGVVVRAYCNIHGLWKG